MTISESIVTWLKNNSTISILNDFDTDLIQAKATAYGIYKAPERNIVEYQDGSQLITEYYMLLARQSSQLENERVNNQKFLSDLETWVDTKNFNFQFPVLATGLSCQNIGISSTYYLQEEEEEQSTYQLSIEITYSKGR